MLHLLKKLKERRDSLSYANQQLQRYRREHPESLEKDTEQVQQWIARVTEIRKRTVSTVEVRQYQEEQRAIALQKLRDVAREAFMSHPAATEADFRRCWPHIREEILKQHALEELAGR